MESVCVLWLQIEWWNQLKQMFYFPKHLLLILAGKRAQTLNLHCSEPHGNQTGCFSVAICGQDHLRVWSKRSDLSGCVHTCTYIPQLVIGSPSMLVNARCIQGLCAIESSVFSATGHLLFDLYVVSLLEMKEAWRPIVAIMPWLNLPSLYLKCSMFRVGFAHLYSVSVIFRSTYVSSKSNSKKCGFWVGNMSFVNVNRINFSLCLWLVRVDLMLCYLCMWQSSMISWHNKHHSGCLRLKVLLLAEVLATYRSKEMTFVTFSVRSSPLSSPFRNTASSWIKLFLLSEWRHLGTLCLQKENIH